MLEAAQRATGLTPNRPVRCSGGSCSPATRPRSRSPGSRAASGAGWRWRCSSASGAANVLILDEPTNHLDIESREALEDALRGFTGAMLLVSHDRALLDAVGTRTVSVEDGTLRSYEGGWPEYVRLREERRPVGEAEPAAASRRGRMRPRQRARMRRPPRGGTCRQRRIAGRNHPVTGERLCAQVQAQARGPSKNRLSAQATAEQASKAEAAMRGSRSSSPTPRRGRRSTSRPSPRPATRPRAGRWRMPTRSWRRWWSDVGGQLVSFQYESRK